MVQNVDYEVPYLRKQMAKCSQQMADAERRQGEYVRSAAQCAANYKKVRRDPVGASTTTAAVATARDFVCVRGTNRRRPASSSIVVACLPASPCL